MTDEEIIEFIANKKEPIENESLEFKCKRDATGNGIEGETIKIGTGTLSNVFEIGRMYEPVTVLSNQLFGFVNQRGDAYLITKYNFTSETKIILNEIDDTSIVIE